MDNFLSKEQLWKQRLKQWRSSGKNIAEWCRNHDISRATFDYWKKKLSNELQAKSSFIELFDTQQTSGISLLAGTISIKLDQHFDEATLKRCLEVLGDM